MWVDKAKVLFIIILYLSLPHLDIDVAQPIWLSGCLMEAWFTAKNVFFVFFAVNWAWGYGIMNNTVNRKRNHVINFIEYNDNLLVVLDETKRVSN